MSLCTSQSAPATSTDPEIHLSQAQLTAINNNMNNESWTPLPFDLRLGTPFTYSDRAISQISNTEAFNTGIDLRDGDQCIVCGVSHYDIVQHAPIIPQVEYDTWKLMRERKFIPTPAKSVQHEPRNGIILCPNHHALFDAYCFYIRWVLQVRRFVLMNHSGNPYLEQSHGRAIRLFPDDPRVPFHGAFLFHEMRVRGHLPLAEDRPLRLPIRWQAWMPKVSGNNGNGSDDDGEDDDHDDADCTDGNIRDGYADNNHLRHGGSPKAVRSTSPPQMLIFTNPFANVVELEALKRDFAQQPNWKASLVEGESWEGTAEENIAKWKNL